MATDNEIEKVFNTVLGAGLDFPPRVDEIPIRVNAWCELLSDIPGDLLLQAARDIAISGEKFPSVPRMREAAHRVKAQNGTSAAPDHFKPDPQARVIWIPQNPPPAMVIFPPEVQHKIDILVERIGDGLMSDAQLEYIDKLTAPYKQGAVCTA